MRIRAAQLHVLQEALCHALALNTLGPARASILHFSASDQFYLPSLAAFSSRVRLSIQTVSSPLRANKPHYEQSNKANLWAGRTVPWSVALLSTSRRVLSLTKPEVLPGHNVCGQLLNTGGGSVAVGVAQRTVGLGHGPGWRMSFKTTSMWCVHFRKMTAKDDGKLRSTEEDIHVFLWASYISGHASSVSPHC